MWGNDEDLLLPRRQESDTLHTSGSIRPGRHHVRRCPGASIYVRVMLGSNPVLVTDGTHPEHDGI